LICVSGPGTHKRSNVKVIAGNDPKPCKHRISQPNEGNFAQFWSHMYLGFEDVLISFWDQRSRSPQVLTRKEGECNIFVNIFTKIESAID